MAMDALERLFEDAKNSSRNQASQYTIDDQLDIDDDFLGVMSDSSKDRLLSRIQKVDLDENESLVEEPLDEPSNDLKDFNENIKTALDYNLVDESNEEENIEEDEFKFGQVKLDDIDDESDEEDSEEEEEEKEEPVVEQKRGRGRPRKKPLEESNSTTKTTESPIQKSTSSNILTADIKSLNDFMDSLAKDLINELRESNYRTHNFNKKQMDVILDYIENKI